LQCLEALAFTYKEVDPRKNPYNLDRIQEGSGSARDFHMALD